MEANGLELKLSPFDPLAVLDEIERLVPGYKLDRINLFAGNDVQTQPAIESGFVPVESLSEGMPMTLGRNGLFQSGVAGNHSSLLNALERHQAKEFVETAAY
jgi:NADH-quinone oxidoreductase subunit G